MTQHKPFKVRSGALLAALCCSLVALPVHAADIPPADAGWTLRDYFVWAHNDLALKLLDASFLPPEAFDAQDVLLALDYLQTANDLRALEGKAPLAISDLQLAQAFYMASFNDDPLQYHPVSGLEEVSLAWGHTPGAPMRDPHDGQAGDRNPFDAWYTNDRQLLEEQPDLPHAGQTYHRLVSDAFVLSGFAIAPGAPGFDTVFAQTFATHSAAGEQALSLEDFRARLEQFAADFAAGITENDRQALFRLYNPNSGEHFFTVSEIEADSLQKAGWVDEGVAWISGAAHSGVPVFRLYNRNEGDHHYTLSQHEREVLIGYGWCDEGVSFYAGADAQGPTVWRLYNPNARSGAHHFTLDETEYQRLGELGWNQEGPAWNAFSLQ